MAEFHIKKKHKPGGKHIRRDPITCERENAIAEFVLGGKQVIDKHLITMRGRFGVASDIDAMRLLFWVGSFGKGALSRSTPSRLQQLACLRSGQRYVPGPKKAGRGKSLPRGEEKVRVITRLYETEDLILSPEEVLYLAARLQWIDVAAPTSSATSTGNIMKIDELWRHLGGIQSDGSRLHEHFIYLYCGYRHLRDRGWAPRCGQKFGCDYVVYSDAVSQVHGECCAVILPVSKETKAPLQSCYHLSWPAIQNWQRVASTVAKTLLLVYVLVPANVDLSTPACLAAMSVEENLVTRAVTKKDIMRKHKKTGHAS